MQRIESVVARKEFRKGGLYALTAAVISGFSIYLNKFAVMQMQDPFVFTTAKNLTVVALLFGLFLLPKALPELRRLSRRQWLSLAALGCVGGSVPFLLFFYGLSLTDAASAGFIHKTLFVWVAVLAVFFLGERLSKFHLAALVALVSGTLLLLGWPRSLMSGGGQWAILAATLLWAVEVVVAKKVMTGVNSSVAAFGRMFFGAAIMLGYLGVTGRLSLMTGLTGPELGWIAFTSVFLLGYVSCYYAGLKHAPASIAASILVVGSVITNLLYAIFDARRYSLEEVVGMALVVAATLALWYLAPRAGLRTGRLSSIEVET